MAKLLERNKLKFIAMGFTGPGAAGVAGSLEKHIESFEQIVSHAGEYGAVKVTVHSARDAFSFDDQCRFYEAAVKLEEKHRVAVGHETHRGRAMFTPWTTAALLRKFPALKVCADFSHWTCVAESMLADNAADVALATTRTLHTHARVGYEEGPQVTDPAAPEFAGQLAKFEEWWGAIWKSQKAAGMEVSTVTPEFGPPGYMHTLPYTKQPVADLWSVCLWMAERVKGRFAETMG